MQSFVTTMFTDATNGWNQAIFMSIYLWGFPVLHFFWSIKPSIILCCDFFFQNSQFWLLCLWSKHHFRHCPKVKITIFVTRIPVWKNSIMLQLCWCEHLMWLNCVQQNIINNEPTLGMYRFFLRFINANLTHVLNIFHREAVKYTNYTKMLYKLWNDTCTFIHTYIIQYVSNLNELVG